MKAVMTLWNCCNFPTVHANPSTETGGEIYWHISPTEMFIHQPPHSTLCGLADSFCATPTPALDQSLDSLFALLFSVVRSLNGAVITHLFCMAVHRAPLC